MSRFPTAGHLISWAGLYPRNDESAGKRRSTRLRKGAPWLKTTLVQCAWAASRKKASYLQAQFQRLRHRRGPKKTICAIAASILTAVYHMLRAGTFYQDLGANHSLCCTDPAGCHRPSDWRRRESLSPSMVARCAIQAQCRSSPSHSEAAAQSGELG
jgi:Transposase IS116/IS110/IS902 family